MRALFRVDGGTRIGAGHVMRCLALADGLAERGARCHFVCRAHPGAPLDRIRASGHAVDALPLEEAADDAPAHAGWVGARSHSDASATRARLAAALPDWIVVDHYGLDARWETALAACGARLLVIDDLADRPHVADLLLDTTPGRTEADYWSLVRGSCRFLLGPGHALLRPEFVAAREAALARRDGRPVRRLLVSMGGGDPQALAAHVLAAVAETFGASAPAVTVVVGAGSSSREAIEAQAARMASPVDVRHDVRDMAALMVEADLAVGGAGTTSWERCCLGLPAVTVIMADNQRLIAERLQVAGAGLAVDASVEGGRLESRLAAALRRLVGDAEGRATMAARAADLVDGTGVQKLVEAMTSPARREQAP